MKMYRPVLSAALLVLTLGSLTTQFAQEPSTQPVKPTQEKRFVGIALIRTINTAELSYKYKYGSYGTWRMLLSDGRQHFEEFLSIHDLQQSNSRLGDEPETLPGWNLRLNVHADGTGYDVLLEDKTDKEGFAALSDERAAIRECKWLR